MSRIPLMISAILFLGLTHAEAQNLSTLGKKLEHVIKQKEPTWRFNAPFRTLATRGLPDALVGALVDNERAVSLAISRLASRREAVNELHKSQGMFKAKPTRPLSGIGDEGFEASGGGGVFLFFTKANWLVLVFVVRRNASLSELKEIENGESPRMRRLTAVAREKAEDFARIVADQITLE